MAVPKPETGSAFSIGNSSRREFRRQFTRAVDQAFSAGEINRGQAIRLRIASFRPEVLDLVEQECCAQAIAEGRFKSHTDGGYEIDWTLDGILEFLRGLLQIIMELFGI